MAFRHARRPSFPSRLGTAAAALALSASTLGLVGAAAWAYGPCDGATVNSSTGSETFTIPVTNGSLRIEYRGEESVGVTGLNADDLTDCTKYNNVTSIAVVGTSGNNTVTLVATDMSLLPTITVDLVSGTDKLILEGTTESDDLDANDLSTLSNIDTLQFDALGGNDVMTPKNSFGNSVTSNLANVTFNAGAGTDTADLHLYTGGNSWTLPSGLENFIGGTGVDAIHGNDLANRIDAGSTDDDEELWGEGGNDVLIGGPGEDTFHGGSGNDAISYSAVTAVVKFDLARTNNCFTPGNGATCDVYQYDKDLAPDGDVENLVGGSGNDVLLGTDEANYIDGGLGNDLIEGLGGADTLEGGLGTGDTVSYASSGKGVTVNLGAAFPSGVGSDAAGDLIGDFENVIGSDFADTLTGTSGDNELNGGEGNDLLAGLAGEDTLNGGRGTHDVASYAASAAGVSVSLVAGTGKGGDAEGDALVKVEDLIGSDEGDTLIGNRLANMISGGDGDDFLTGDVSADTLNGGSGSDTVSYAYSSEPVTVSLRAGTASGDGTAGDTLISIENVIGSSYSDYIVGNDAKNALNGGGGNDTLIGLGGSDRLYGSTGADVLNGGDGADRVEGGGGADKIDGGSGTDVCKDGPGKDTVLNCEK